MTVSAGRYRVPFISERVLPRIANGTWNGCRISTAWMGSALATLGESTMAPTGGVKRVAGRRSDLLDMRQATGHPERDGFNQSHVPAIHGALGLPAPEVWTGTFDELWADDGAFAIAGNPQDIHGASTLERIAAERGWSGANHEMLLLPKRTATHGWVMDPMRPQGAYRGDKVPKAEIRQFMRSEELKNHGKPVAERYGVGEWTAAARTRGRMMVRMDDLVEESSRTEARLRARIAVLEEGGTVDCTDPIAAALERERVAIRDIVDQRRSL